MFEGTQADTGFQVIDNAQEAAGFLKAMANKNRLLVLCHLLAGEKTVTELENLLGIRQPTLSQQLARLRSENLVATRRSAKSVYYSLASRDVEQVIEALQGKFRDPATAPQRELLPAE